MSAKQAKAAAAAAAAAANNAQSSASLVFNSNAALDPQAFLMATKLAESTGNTVQIVQMPGGQPAAVLLQPQQAHLAAAAGVGVIPTARLQNPFGLAGIGVGLAQLPNGLALAHQSMPPPAASPHEEEHRKTLSRRPSYRKILNEIADQRAGVKSEGVDEDSESDDGGEPPAHRARSSRGALAQSHADASAAAQGVLGFQIPQSLAGATTLGLPGQQAAILQYAQQGPDGQFYIPATALQQVAAYQVAGANSAAPGFFVAASQSTVQLQTNASQSQAASSGSLSLGAPLAIGVGGEHEANRKREVRLLKNREAARECRLKKKGYVKALENRVAMLESQNKALIDELKALKELYCTSKQTDGPGGAAASSSGAGTSGAGASSASPPPPKLEAPIPIPVPISSIALAAADVPSPLGDHSSSNSSDDSS